MLTSQLPRDGSIIVLRFIEGPDAPPRVSGQDVTVALACRSENINDDQPSIANRAGPV